MDYKGNETIAAYNETAVETEKRLGCFELYSLPFTETL